MKKNSNKAWGKFIFPILLLVIFVSFFLLRSSGPKKQEEQKNSLFTQEILRHSLDISRAYIDLRLRTEHVLVEAKEYADYESWREDLDEIVLDWGRLELSSQNLEKMAKEYIKARIVLLPIKSAKAYTQQEINDVFDKAPSGKKIATLANFLGVDAKRAQLILNGVQDEIHQDIWKEEGDTYKKLETTAVVVKDSCKVAGFVGGVVLTGGAAGFAASGIVAQTATVVAGADLVLEIGEDAAYIALGDKNQVSELVGDIRKISEPASTVLNIASMPEKMVTGLDKLNVWSFGADQILSAVQDGKVLSVTLPGYKGTKEPNLELASQIDAKSMTMEEIDEWLKENNINLASQGEDQSKIIMDDLQESIERGLSLPGKLESKLESKKENKKAEKDSKKAEKNSKKNEKEDDFETAGFINSRWMGTLSSALDEYDDERIIVEYDLILNKDKSVSDNSQASENKFTKWEQDEDFLRLYGAEGKDSYHEFELVNKGKTITLNQIVLDGQSIKPRSAYEGGLAPSGSFYRQPSSKPIDEKTSKSNALRIWEYERMSDNNELRTLAQVSSKLGSPDINTMDGSHLTYVYLDILEYYDGSFASLVFNFLNEEQYREYIEGRGANWDSNKYYWEESGGGVTIYSNYSAGDSYRNYYQ